MAFAAQLSALTDELVEVITSTPPQSNGANLKVLRESSLRKLRNNSFLRTNQFEVYKTLDGLEERFRVVDRDRLADALRERLDALSQRSNRWTPDILHLLLQLSDQPIQKTKLLDLEALRKPEGSHEPTLNWRDIAKEDGWDQDRDIWKNVKFGDYSSDEDSIEETSVSSRSEDTSLSSIEARYRRRATDYLEDKQDPNAIDCIRTSQAWRLDTTPKDSSGRPKKITITELQAVREVLFMLNGLDNTAFHEQAAPSTRFQLTHASWEVYRALLTSFGEAGRCLLALRNFTQQPQQIPLLQVFRDAIQQRLRSFDSFISQLQSHYVHIQVDTTVSLAKILSEVKPRLQPLVSISDIIHQLGQAKLGPPFHYLELLFDAAGYAQLEGNDSTYEFMAEIFFQCFDVYLRPIRLWMEEGELEQSGDTFFIASSQTEVPKQQVWMDQFELRMDEGKLYAPRFLQPAMSKIFRTGKSVVVLKMLGKYPSTRETTSKPQMNFEGGLASGSAAFTPFSEVFESMFEQWMQSRHHAAATTLRHVLFSSCGLKTAMNDIHHLYLMSNGACSAAFAGDIFHNLDILNPRWYDRFTLTEIAHEAFDQVVEVHRLSVDVAPLESELGRAHVIRKTVRKGLPSIRLTYRQTWPTRVILTDESLAQYHALFTLLLQSRRANYVLHRYRMVSDGMGELTSEQAIYYGLRTRLLWFCSSFQSYLTTLVLGPLVSEVRNSLEEAEDVDTMISVHAAFTKRMIDEACLGSKLDPIHQCILDVFDLAIRVEDARQMQAARTHGEVRDMTESDKKRHVKESEREDETFLLEQDRIGTLQGAEKDYIEILHEVRDDLDKHLKFICGGLRGVARASGNVAATKWDMLAEMLEVGIQGR
ncbi:Spc98 family-domain-containing protein [Xylariomycetidae sp. FL0641]|nr:Spc98 family-domain-containing protein [Xylariomycetidae sp. FL0641]